MSNLQKTLKKRLTNLSNLVITRNDENDGCYKLINAELAKTQGDIITFSNHEVIYYTDAISKVTSFLNNNNRITICQFNSLLPSGEAYAVAVYLKPLSCARSFLVDQLALISFTEASAIAIKRDVIDRVGNLDDDYFIEYEDQDFCWRAVLHGFKIAYLLDAIVHHYRRKVEKPSYFILERTVYLYLRNHISNLIKNLELHSIWYYLPEVLLIELCKVLLILLIRRNLRLALKIFEGIIAPFLKIQQSKSIPDKQVLKDFVPFMPVLQLNYPKHQAAGKKDMRLMINYCSDSWQPKVS